MKEGDLTAIKIYDNIVAIAKDKKISINSMEKESGLSIGSICKWNTVSPSVKSLHKVATILGCTIDDLIREEG